MTVAGPVSAAPPALVRSARAFEAMALGELLAPMFATLDTAHSAFGGGDAEATWQPILAREIARAAADAGGIGLAQPVLAALLRVQANQQNRA